tara:strand:+ start:318 stop:833 length:516 start_codon:yes stop_codon:yes gene_type:complete
MDKQNEKQDQPSATIHLTGAVAKPPNITSSSQEQISKLEALQTESGQRIIELVERVEKLKKQLSTAQNIVDEQTNSQRQIVNDTIVEHREQMYTLFESIPHLNVWIEGLIRGLLLDMQFEGTIVDSDDVRAIVEEEIDDAKEDAQTIATEKIEGLIKDALDSVEVESHLIY